MALAVNDPQRLTETFASDDRAPSSVIRGGVVVGGETNALVRARQEATASG